MAFLHSPFQRVGDCFLLTAGIRNSDACTYIAIAIKTVKDDMERIELKDIKRILVCQLRQIGDVLLATPSIELLRKRFPHAALDVFTEKNAAPMLFNNPHIDRIWALDRKVVTNFFQEMRFYWTLCRQGNYDLVVDFQQLPRCRWVVAFSGARVRLSYDAPLYTRFLYTHTAPMREAYAAAKKASILSPLGIEWNGELPRIYLDETERARAREILAQAGLRAGQRLITIDPSHRRDTRRWPAEYYSRIVSMAAARWNDARFLVLYGPGEEELAQEVIAKSTCPTYCLQPPKMLTLREMAACQERAVLHFGNCSAPRHIAVAVGTRTLTVLGSTDVNWTCPGGRHRDIALGLSCQPCSRNVCERGVLCLKNLTPDMVFPLFSEMLGE